MSDFNESNAREENKSGLKNQSALRESNRIPIADRQASIITILSSQITDNEEDEDLVCPVCSNLLWEPIGCSTCKLHVCLKCIQDWLRKGNQTCPISACDEFIEDRVHPYFLKHLQSVHIQCPNVINGCSESISYKEYSQHIEQSCPYANLKCPFEGCGRTLLRRDMPCHCETCEYALKECQFCKEWFSKGQIQAHETEDCVERQIICPNENCQEYFKKKDQEQHMLNCEFEKNPCQYCQALIEKQYLYQHEESCEERTAVCSGCGGQVKFSQIQTHESQCEYVIKSCEQCETELNQFEFNQVHTETYCLKKRIAKSTEANLRLEEENKTLKNQLESHSQKLDFILERLAQARLKPSEIMEHESAIEQAYMTIFMIFESNKFLSHQKQKHLFQPASAREALRHFQYLEDTSRLYSGWHKFHCSDCMGYVGKLQPLLKPHLQTIQTSTVALFGTAIPTLRLEATI